MKTDHKRVSKKYQIAPESHQETIGPLTKRQWKRRGITPKKLSEEVTVFNESTNESSPLQKLIRDGTCTEIVRTVRVYKLQGHFRMKVKVRPTGRMKRAKAKVVEKPQLGN